jgi:predicted AAA+ superfamily ATPase
MLSWKANDHFRLQIEGIRQCGKTCLVEMFGKCEFECFIELLDKCYVIMRANIFSDILILLHGYVDAYM